MVFWSQGILTKHFWSKRFHHRYAVIWPQVSNGGRAGKIVRWGMILLYGFWFGSQFDLRSLERFSNECRKTKTIVITLTNQKGRKQSSKPIKTRTNYT